MSPFVVTLAIEDDAQTRFDAERRRLFPRTQVGAHVTLFHAVPGEVDVVPALRSAADRPRFEVRVSEVMGLGRGVAYRLESAELGRVHAELRQVWSWHLTPQDAQGFRPHVTVQNKVAPELARRTMAELSAEFAPYAVGAVGLDLWRYEGGPWSHVERWSFG
ncbi:2'-5' RNA ligase family protein [Nocardioides mangrovicus]|uniref:2'-5' RNA ligase family protein n=1 Tax=Nocardioides mangrovicus TaxID=2478913 RepID=A0A3L8P7Y2_9ACTN|nr:2'-5' RNA ligase family protein [Nocardioides mangrovicus]RLV50739.1 2'-5' RNA ligase family protein [Nocardioides mangrovicus]